MRSMSVEFRGAIVEIVYDPLGSDDVSWWFAEDGLNDIALTARERRDIRLEALGESRR